MNSQITQTWRKTEKHELSCQLGLLSPNKLVSEQILPKKSSNPIEQTQPYDFLLLFFHPAAFWVGWITQDTNGVECCRASVNLVNCGKPLMSCEHSNLSMMQMKGDAIHFKDVYFRIIKLYYVKHFKNSTFLCLMWLCCLAANGHWIQVFWSLPCLQMYKIKHLGMTPTI